MAKEQVQILPDLSTFTLEAYSHFEERRAYVNTVLHNRGEDISPEWLPILDSPGGTRLMISFLKDSGYAPGTRLGQLIQLIASEGSLASYIRVQDRINCTGAKVIEASTVVLPQVHRVKRKIAKEIFGEEDAEEQMDRLSNTFFSHRIKDYNKPFETEDQRLRKRRAAFKELVQEVTERFPLTSR